MCISHPAHTLPYPIHAAQLRGSQCGDVEGEQHLQEEAEGVQARGVQLHAQRLNLVPHLRRVGAMGAEGRGM